MQINSTGFATKYKTISFRFLPAASDMLSLSCGCNGKKGSIFLGGTTKKLKMDFTWMFNEFLVLFFLGNFAKHLLTVQAGTNATVMAKITKLHILMSQKSLQNKKVLQRYSNLFTSNLGFSSVFSLFSFRVPTKLILNMPVGF